MRVGPLTPVIPAPMGDIFGGTGKSGGLGFGLQVAGMLATHYWPVTLAVAGTTLLMARKADDSLVKAGLFMIPIAAVGLVGWTAYKELK